MPETTSSPETFTQPAIEGLRIVDVIDPAIITALPETGSRDIFSSGAVLLRVFEPIKGLIQSAADETGRDFGEISVAVVKSPYDEKIKDPFYAKRLNRITGGTAEGFAHRDAIERFVRLVCDSNPTIFYPSDNSGNAILSEPWRPKAGQVVQFDNTVWHSPPLEASGSGVRTLLTLRIDR